jgi:hypothetical protein
MSPLTHRLLLTSVLVTAASAATWAQITMSQSQPMRDTRVAASGPAEISGVLVTDEETPQPVRRAEVRAFAPGAGPRTTTTDAMGRFRFANLPLGRYTIEASKPGFVRAAYGARRPDRPGTPVTLTDSQKTQALQMRMARGSVITGRIVDEFGQPAQGARVRAQQVRVVNGERTLSDVPTPGALFGETVDDRGVYRLYGLPAGDYVVSATPRNTGIGDIRRMSEAELRAAELAVQQPTRATDSQDPPEPPVMLGFSAVFFPGVPNAGQAGTITVKAGEERSGVDFAVQYVRTATLEGQVLTPGSVRPETVQLLVLPRQSTTAASASGNTMMFTTTLSGGSRRVGPDGRFSLTGITPGPYTISARVNPDGAPALWASADVDVDGQPITGITLALQEGMNVSGQLAFDADGVDPPDTFTRARINLIPVDGNIGVMLGGNTTEITSSGAFTITGVTPGRYRVSANFSTPEANWTLKSAVIKGKDGLDVVIDVAPGDVITDAVFTFTNRTQELTGTLQDASQRPAPDYTVVIFPADKALWASTRRVRSTRPGTDGKFSIPNLPAGSYRIAAAVDIGAEELRDPSLLEELLAASIAFTIGDGDRKVQDLRIAGGVF